MLWQPLCKIITNCLSSRFSRNIIIGKVKKKIVLFYEAHICLRHAN